MEDLIGQQLYVSLVNKAYNLSKKIQLDKSQKVTRIVPYVTKQMAAQGSQVPQYDRFTPAQWLLKNPTFLEPKAFSFSRVNISDVLDRFEKIFIQVNSLLHKD